MRGARRITAHTLRQAPRRRIRAPKALRGELLSSLRAMKQAQHVENDFSYSFNADFCSRRSNETRAARFRSRT
jgi:hypothetical protein